VTWGKLLYLSEPCFPILQDSNNDTFHLDGMEMEGIQNGSWFIAKDPQFVDGWTDCL
jgi:hypothetical protein